MSQEFYDDGCGKAECTENVNNVYKNGPIVVRDIRKSRGREV